ncbi:NAD(P)-dependent oxidoreductase [Tenacibaculum insulae]|uniref:NAD(P)-dependent oxidoreductase n=1 Tax=Tenacibaculum insulae TaxID=2029677 RepID=UPI003AB4915F
MKEKFKVLLTSTSFQDTPGKHIELLEKQNYDVDTLRGPVNEKVLLPIIGDYDAVICGDDEYTEGVLRKGALGKLKFISKYGVGLDKINLKVAKEIGIPVTNCPGVNQVSVAEHVLALLFTFEKNIHIQNETTKRGSWKRLTGNEIEGKTIGIIGLGSIGKELAKKSLALGLNVIAFDVYKNENFLEKFPNVFFTNELNYLYENSDVISLHVPHTSETDELINETVINTNLLKKPIIINTARGKLVNTESIINGLEKGKIRGYLADVLAIEPIEDREKLRGLNDVIITPHVGSRTNQSVERQGVMAVGNLVRMFTKL